MCDAANVIDTCNKCGSGVCDDKICSLDFPHWHDTTLIICASCVEKIMDLRDIPPQPGSRKLTIAESVLPCLHHALPPLVEQVPSEKKKGMVKGVFTSVAHNYDVMNDLMSARESARLTSLVLVQLPHISQLGVVRTADCGRAHLAVAKFRWARLSKHVPRTTTSAGNSRRDILPSRTPKRQAPPLILASLADC